MGWCHEFGPQIAEGCDHPMTAGPSSCSCERCGTVCTGRFGGCADVWDNGPRHVVTRGPGRSDRLDTAPAGDDPDGGSTAVGDLDGDLGSDLASGTGMSAVLAHLFERVEALEIVPARMAALEGAGAGARPDTEAIAAIATQLEHLTARLGDLDALGRRVEALEQQSVTAAPHADAAHKGVELRSLEELAQRTVDELHQHRARTIERLDELAGSVTALGQLPERVGALEWVAEGTTAVQEALTELGRGLDRLSVDADQLSAVPDRVEVFERTAGEAIEALERTAGGALDALDQRLGGLEKAVADLGQGLEDLTTEVVRLGALPGRVEALEQADEPVTAEAFDAVHTTVEQLGERAGAVEALPHRVDALERSAFGGRPFHHRSRSIVADLDALGSQVEVVATAVDGVPRRLADVERSAARTEALERGLAGAIDMIDQLGAQLAALEWAFRPLPPPGEGDGTEGRAS